MDWQIELSYREHEALMAGTLTHLIRKNFDSRLWDREGVTLCYGPYRLPIVKLRSHTSGVVEAQHVPEGVEPLTLAHIKGAGFASKKDYLSWASDIKLSSWVYLVTLGEVTRT